MNIAQQIANLAQTNMPAAMARAKAADFQTGAVWFGGREITFQDGSVCVIRMGKIESPLPSQAAYQNHDA